MRSQLTRHIFRRILLNQSLVTHHCTRCPSARLAPRLNGFMENYRCFHASPKRSIFGFEKPRRRMREMDVEPGVETMLKLVSVKDKNGRPPHREFLVRAWEEFFRHKEREKVVVQPYQARLALAVYAHLAKNVEEDLGVEISTKSLQEALYSLSLELNKITIPEIEAHLELARRIEAELGKRREERPMETQDKPAYYLTAFLTILCRAGQKDVARNMVEERPQDTSFRQHGKKMWRILIRYTLDDGDVGQLPDLLKGMEAQGFPIDAEVHETIMAKLTVLNDVPNTKYWYTCPLSKGEKPTKYSHAQFIKFCIRNDQLQWGEEAFLSWQRDDRSKSTNDLILQWRLARTGFEQLESSFQSMDSDSDARPDSVTINGLLQVARQKKDAYAAERVIQLGQKWGIDPDVDTLMIQINYRLDANDTQGALQDYQQLQTHTIPRSQDDSTINRLIRDLCAAPSPKYSTITSITEDLEDRRGRFEATTIAALSEMYLSRREFDDLSDLLNTYTFHFSLQERDAIRSVIVDYCFSPTNTINDIWTVYVIHTRCFPDAPNRKTAPFLRLFFSRSRGDLACLVFSHMKAHAPQDNLSAEIYTDAFEALAQGGDAEALALIHNSLQLDTAVEPNTRLRNALMLAYTACDMPQRALDLWHEIATSREGPSWASILIAFRACERKPFGDQPARAIYQMLRERDVPIDGKVYAAYVGAIAGQGKVRDACELVTKMEGKLGLEVGTLVLGTFYNAMPGQERKDEVREWGKKAYPDVWAQLDAQGMHRYKKPRARGDPADDDPEPELPEGVEVLDWDEVDLYNIDREVRA